MNNAEWWANECDGVFCSACGFFFDDYYEPAPDQCKNCGSIMTKNYGVTVWRNGHLSLDLDGVFVDKDKHPKWLQELKER